MTIKYGMTTFWSKHLQMNEDSKSKINKELIKRKFFEGRKYVERAEEIIKLPLEEQEYLSIQLQIERIFEVLSQLILDVCTHIVSKIGKDVPETYADCVVSIAKLGILNESKIKDFINIIKMRNFIAHQYGKVDFLTVMNNFRRLLDDFQIYQNEILKWLGND